MSAIAQSFKPSTNGALQQIEIKISGFDTGIILSLHLYVGSIPVQGIFLTSSEFKVENEGWNTVSFSPGFELHSDLTYYFIISAVEDSTAQASIWTSQGSPGGEHAGGSLFYFNPVSGDFEAEPIDDVDFKVVLQTNSPGWRNLY